MARGLLWLFLLLVVALAGSFWWLKGQTTPRTAGQVNLAPGGVGRPVTVTRDQWGVPHIRAATDAVLRESPDAEIAVVLRGALAALGRTK